MSLNILLLITLFILIIPFVIYLKSTNKKGKMPYAIACFIYLGVASPVVYAVINHKIVQYVDANIGLGLAFFTTWFLTICLFLISLVFFFKKRRNKE
ncbi:hypothetical protein [Calidifontibacillus oryziterrae]|uniref:hypothetical protein n=1 Tax=Calidifontibacillus oryziterrae TaxID=1191699 RepID=UPI0002F7F995|nr:hypothetical protein [Calidifontibacillus oryziterrae]